MHPQVAKLMKIPSEDQRSSEWHKKRENMLTASRFPAALGNDIYKTAKLLLRQLVGRSKETGNYFMMQHGIDTEDSVRKMYEEKTGEKVIQFGCICHTEVNPSGFPELGGSPDGVTETGRLIEIKCPVSRKLVKDYVPPHYIDQIQGLMYILELDICDFIEYRASSKEFQIISVPKDPQWAKKNIPLLLDFWKTVLETRKEIEEHIERSQRSVAKLCGASIQHYWATRKLEKVTKEYKIVMEEEKIYELKFRQRKRKRSKTIFDTEECLVVLPKRKK